MPPRVPVRSLTAGRRDDPRPDLDDRVHSASSAGRNASGPSDAEPGCRQRRSASTPTKAFGLEVDGRLVEEEELAPVAIARPARRHAGRCGVAGCLAVLAVVAPRPSRVASPRRGRRLASSVPSARKFLSTPTTRHTRRGPPRARDTTCVAAAARVSEARSRRSTAATSRDASSERRRVRGADRDGHWSWRNDSVVRRRRTSRGHRTTVEHSLGKQGRALSFDQSERTPDARRCASSLGGRVDKWETSSVVGIATARASSTASRAFASRGTTLCFAPTCGSSTSTRPRASTATTASRARCVDASSRRATASRCSSSGFAPTARSSPACVPRPARGEPPDRAARGDGPSPEIDEIGRVIDGHIAHGAIEIKGAFSKGESVTGHRLVATISRSRHPRDAVARCGVRGRGGLRHPARDRARHRRAPDRHHVGAVPRRALPNRGGASGSERAATSCARRRTSWTCASRPSSCRGASRCNGPGRSSEPSSARRGVRWSSTCRSRAHREVLQVLREDPSLQVLDRYPEQRSRARRRCDRPGAARCSTRASAGCTSPGAARSCACSRRGASPRFASTATATS